MDRSFISQVIINGLLLCDKHTVRHGECKSEEDKHTCPYGDNTLGNKTVKTSTCNTVGYRGATRSIIYR